MTEMTAKEIKSEIKWTARNIAIAKRDLLKAEMKIETLKKLNRLEEENRDFLLSKDALNYLEKEISRKIAENCESIENELENIDFLKKQIAENNAYIAELETALTQVA